MLTLILKERKRKYQELTKNPGSFYSNVMKAVLPKGRKITISALNYPFLSSTQNSLSELSERSRCYTVKYPMYRLLVVSKPLLDFLGTIHNLCLGEGSGKKEQGGRAIKINR